MKRVIGLGMVSVLLLSACVEADQVEVEEQVEELVISRNFEKPPGAADYLHNYQDTVIPELDTDTLQSLTEERELADRLTREEMEEDLKTFLSAMRYGYGPYEFYGGDEAFLSAADDMMQWVSSADAEVEGEDYADQLREHFSFIKDQHFVIHGQNAYEKELAQYGVEEWTFTKENEAYFFNDEEVTLINDESPEDLLKPSFDENGELIYRAVSLSEGEAEQWEIETAADIYTGKPEKLFTNPGGMKPFEVSETDTDIPVITWRTMLAYEDDPYTYDDMLDTVDLIKEAPAAILDLRNNMGGNLYLVNKFIHELTGSPPSHSETVFLETNTVHALLSHTRETLEETGLDSETFYDHLPEAVYGEYDANFTDVSPISRVETFGTEWAGTGVEISKEPSLDTPLYVLMNENTASAGEIMVEALMEYDNTVLIGGPSAGVFTSDMGSMLFLPHSGIMIGMPSTLIMSPYSYGREAVGLEPDVWLSGDGVMVRTVEWAERMLAEEELAEEVAQ
ncbi:S41 family peptidase [Jeotgalibacillus haloalkalitolerans]|uniref:S41 family peptidase n=1 Tax=Jeotgalibacillus haloalkalitolerans TaxID=3104292 RepID=A0ABU5KNB1_9BACL|nr:S41 family peptidase [Jeotgalibacillus sp. HH7-29]MDZ5712749.1 S41 family peptidase [Jeotgalibacillus sp. HH7-29]